jgi:hypothetical protein
VRGLGAGALVVVHGQWSSLSAVLAVRVEAGSSPRVRVADAAMNLVVEHPLAGGGPGSSPVTYPGADGSVQAMRYLHDEYLEVLLALGAPGLVLLVALLAAAAMTLRRAFRRTARPRPRRSSYCCPGGGGSACRVRLRLAPAGGAAAPGRAAGPRDRTTVREDGTVVGRPPATDQRGGVT